MYNVRFNVIGDIKLLSGMRRLRNEFGIGVEEILDAVAERAVGEMKNQAPKMTHDLAESIDVIEKKKGMRAVGPGGSTGTSGSPLPKKYAYWVEKGSAAHWPNISDIAMRYAVDESEAFLIARSISRKPGKATKFAETTMIISRNLFKNTTERMMALLFR